MNSIAILIVTYFILMILIGIVNRKKNMNVDELNIGSGNVSWVAIGISTAATWIWAPALFISSEKAFLDGALGMYWFIIPNVVALLIFGVVAFRANNQKRKKNEHTISSLIGNIYGSGRVKKIYDFELIVLTILSTGVQLLAGGLVISTLTGWNFTVVSILLGLVALSYSWISGLRGSVRTDVAQMFLMIFAVVTLVVALSFAGYGVGSFNGVNNLSTSFFSSDNAMIFLAYGLTTAIGLLSAPFADQTFWQRSFAMDKKKIMKSMTLASGLFAIVPVGMAIIGLMAYNSGFAPTDTSMVGVEFLMSAVSPILVGIFAVCIIAGLSSTLDSNMCSISSIVTDMSEKTRTVKHGRIGMLVIFVAGILIANIPNLDIFWLFLFYGVFRSSVALPTIFSFISKRTIDEKYVFYGILFSFLIAIPTYCIGAIGGVWILSVTGTLLTWIMPSVFLARGVYAWEQSVSIK